MKTIPLALLFIFTANALAQVADWPEPRHDRHLTAIQPIPGAMKSAPVPIAEIDLGRSHVGWNPVKIGPDKRDARATIIAGELRCYDNQGRLLWSSHPPGINFTTIVAAGDIQDDGRCQIALTAGRTAQPYGAALLVSADDGKVLWRYDVEPMSYSWQLYLLDRAASGGLAAGPKQLFIVMHGYPPDAKNGYSILFAYRKVDITRQGAWHQKWRYDFPEYTCFPQMFQLDMDGEGFNDDLSIITHSRIWVLNRRDGALRQFIKWDVSPANYRSYGLNQFVDLNGDGLPDFLCLGYFAKHYEVLLNKNGKLEEAWHVGWEDSVTTSTVAVTWPLPPYADVDGDGKMDVVVSVFNGEGKGGWEIRVHDAVTGKLKYRQPGMIAAALRDVDGDGAAEILADYSDEGSDARTYGDYLVQHPKAAVLLKVRDNQLTTIWEDKTAKAIREPLIAAARVKEGETRRQGEKERQEVARVRIGEEVRILAPDPAGAIVSAWDPTSAAPLENPKPAGGMPEILAADFFGEGKCQLLVYRAGVATIWKSKDGAFERAGEYESTCLPVIADLNGDGKPDLVLADVSEKHLPRFKAITPALHDKVLWDMQFPTAPVPGLPAPRIAYMRPGKFTGRSGDDIYVWTGTPQVRSAVIQGDTGQLLWDRFKEGTIERYWGPSTNLASVFDFNHDGKEDLVFTNPDYYCIADGPTGKPLLGPLFPPDIFRQPSQGLYTMPAILGPNAEGGVAIIGGHYFQAAMSIDAKPAWFALPPTGMNRCANEGFLHLSSDKWAMGFGRQNGKFACLNLSDGSLRWELDVGASCTDVTTCDIDNDGREEFIFGTSHGALYAVGDDEAKPRVLWKIDTGTALGAPVLADISGNGKPEIIVPGEDGRIRVYGAGR
jgi:hypothetical protein